jgi:hypothetical protein
VQRPQSAAAVHALHPGHGLLSEAWADRAHEVFAIVRHTAAGLGLPRWVVGFIAGRRAKKFSLEFPNAVDVIVRGIKSGLPVHAAETGEGDERHAGLVGGGLQAAPSGGGRRQRRGRGKRHARVCRWCVGRSWCCGWGRCCDLGRGPNWWRVCR